MDTVPLSARERILATARLLFYRDGVRATGVDKLIAESGVAKLTFYRHFPAKDDLVRAFLADRHERWMAWFVDALGRHGAGTGRGLPALADALAEWFHDPAYRGCAFINSVAELGDALPDTVAIAQRHKQDMTQVIAELLPAGPQRTALAEAAALAVDGAIVQAQVHGAAPAATGLRRVLAALAAG